MRIDIRPNADWPRGSVALAKRRLEFALGRFADRVRSTSVRLTDLNGPRGGLDKQCRVLVRLAWPKRLIVVEEVDADGPAAISHAAARVARAVSRAVREGGDWRVAQRGY